MIDSTAQHSTAQHSTAQHSTVPSMTALERKSTKIGIIHLSRGYIRNILVLVVMLYICCA
jgi:hypothetical protein